MNQWRLGNGARIIQVLGGRSNVYLIKCHTQKVLIDTGKNNVWKKLIKKLNALGISSIDWLILTHTHFDHCRNAAQLQQKYDCKIMVSKQAQTFIQNGFTPLPSGTNFLTGIISQLGKLLGPKRFSYQPFQVNEFVSSNKTVETGLIKMDLIPTPGHSSDSLSIVVNNDIALVGDTLFGVFPKSVMPPYADDIRLLKLQWQKLIDTGCNIFLPGHGRPVSKELLARFLSKRMA